MASPLPWRPVIYQESNSRVAVKVITKRVFVCHPRRRLQNEILYADEEIDATTADRRTADLLQAMQGSALLRIRQIIYSSTGKALMYVFGLYRSERHMLTIRRYR